jgi:hypothetical protein
MPLIGLENKTFESDFNSIAMMITIGENFAFSRFSDGEVFMMQGQEIVMAKDYCKVKGVVHMGIGFPEDDYKNFNPDDHGFYRNKLEEAFVHRQHNFIKGLSCRCCIGEKDWEWQLNLLRKGHDDLDWNNLSWSNLFINANYLKFVDIMPSLFAKRKIVMTMNKNANLQDLPFNIVKDFRVGPNCIVNDYGIIEEMISWIEKENIQNHLFLFAASSLSNMAIHQLYQRFPNNTYIDIGSALNPFVSGIRSTRNYMRQLDSKKVEYEPCIW